ncbi:MAG TPA: DUF4010 domain-containing protein [Mucilaginibacter sp.]|jgi:uncharacterized membrane protein (DUF4010 family)|nr:DUF4010 domain-containing protein [Mucilaginibacter sp.]
MEKEIAQAIPPDIIKFILVFVFALLIGMEQRRHFIKEGLETQFGTDRTFTLIGILGFILYIISPQTLFPFLGGGAAITVLLSVYYLRKISLQKRFGLTSVVIALITYCLAPLVYTQPTWLVLLIVVAVLVLVEIKTTLLQFSEKFDNDEFITLAKFLVLAGVILPLLPDKPISPLFNFSPYKFWLAIVAVSAISYFSYILKKFVFPNSGIILTGILGGLYSSTATTIILARKSKELEDENKVAAAIILATTMMYVRLFLLALFFNASIALRLAPAFSVSVVFSLVFVLYLYRLKPGKTQTGAAENIQPHNNPLEFKTALLFAALFVLFAFLTGFVTKNYGKGGITLLSFVVGVTDIDPFILNLFQNKGTMNDVVVVTAVLNAVSSNNLLKMIYGITLSDRSVKRPLIAGFGMLIVIGLLMAYVF